MPSEEPGGSRESPAGDGAQRGLNPERRARVLEAAAAALRERGFADTRVADIAERAGMSPGHVMYYFASKEDLLLEALRHTEEGLFYAEVGNVEEGASDWFRMERWIDRSIPAAAGDEQWSLWLELWTRAVHDRRIAAMLQERDDRWTSTLRAIVADGIEHGVFRCERPDAFVDRLSALITGWAIPLTVGSPGADRAAAVADCRDLAAAELHADGDSAGSTGPRTRS
jgi:AcrR family transcriptional regulator